MKPLVRVKGFIAVELSSQMSKQLIKTAASLHKLLHREFGGLVCVFESIGVGDRGIRSSSLLNINTIVLLHSITLEGPLFIATYKLS